ncbi:hypothetical protein, partial [Xanthomonas perforans]
GAAQCGAPSSKATTRRSVSREMVKISPHIRSALQRKASSYLPTGFAEFDPHPVWTTLSVLAFFSPPTRQTLRQ